MRYTSYPKLHEQANNQAVALASTAVQSEYELTDEK